jgi:hypothetical protein
LRRHHDDLEAVDRYITNSIAQLLHAGGGFAGTRKFGGSAHTSNNGFSPVCSIRLDPIAAFWPHQLLSRGIYRRPIDCTGLIHRRNPTGCTSCEPVTGRKAMEELLPKISIKYKNECIIDHQRVSERLIEFVRSCHIFQQWVVRRQVRIDRWLIVYSLNENKQIRCYDHALSVAGVMGVKLLNGQRLDSLRYRIQKICVLRDVPCSTPYTHPINVNPKYENYILLVVSLVDIYNDNCRIDAIRSIYRGQTNGLVYNCYKSPNFWSVDPNFWSVDNDKLHGFAKCHGNTQWFYDGIAQGECKLSTGKSVWFLDGHEYDNETTWRDALAQTWHDFLTITVHIQTFIPTEILWTTFQFTSWLPPDAKPPKKQTL